jgi:hypothetical protein
VGRSVSRCSGAPQLAASLVGIPRWEAFPEVNRALVACLLGVLAGRMMAPVALAGGAGVSGMSAPVRSWERLEGKVGPRHRDRLAAVLCAPVHQAAGP